MLFVAEISPSPLPLRVQLGFNPFKFSTSFNFDNDPFEVLLAVQMKQLESIEMLLIRPRPATLESRKKCNELRK